MRVYLYQDGLLPLCTLGSKYSTKCRFANKIESKELVCGVIVEKAEILHIVKLSLVIS